ncbi:MAG: hypothetical protein JWM27_2717 [Gemmatimonadetes bacterium]|nr:hypothetical protein [Gemmatimonadota bacterium]
MQIDELDVTPVLVRHLRGAGITRVEEVVQLTRAEVRTFHGMGEKVTGRLEAALAKIGAKLRGWPRRAPP